MRDTFTTHLQWTGAAHGATRDAVSFSRDLDVTFEGISMPMSAAPAYRGDRTRANPEQLFVAALSACQALSYLYLAAVEGVLVVAYSDDASGGLGMVDGKRRMAGVTLRPHITLARRADEALARDLVARAHDACFIAGSVAVPVAIEPTVVLTDAADAAP